MRKTILMLIIILVLFSLGCNMKGKGCLITVLVIIVLVIVAAAVLYMNRGKLVEMAVNKMVGQITNNLPVDYDEMMARQNIDDFIVAVKEGRVDKEEFQLLSGIMKRAMEDKKLDTEEVDELIKAMQEAAR